MATAAILDNFEWPYLRNGSRSTYSAHRAVIFAIAQLSCCNNVQLFRTAAAATWPCTYLLVLKARYTECQMQAGCTNIIINYCIVSLLFCSTAYA